MLVKSLHFGLVATPTLYVSTRCHRPQTCVVWHCMNIMTRQRIATGGCLVWNAPCYGWHHFVMIWLTYSYVWPNVILHYLIRSCDIVIVIVMITIIVIINTSDGNNSNNSDSNDNGKHTYLCLPEHRAGHSIRTGKTLLVLLLLLLLFALLLFIVLNIALLFVILNIVVIIISSIKQCCYCY